MIDVPPWREVVESDDRRARANLRLSALAEVGGDIEIRSSAVHNEISGVAPIAELSGSVRIVTGFGDTSIDLLNNVTSVGGDVHLDTGFTTFVLRGLRTVAGDFTIVDGNFFGWPDLSEHTHFPFLETVGGDFVVTNAEFGLSGELPNHIFVALSVVGGRFAWIENSLLSGRADELHVGDPVGLEVGALDVSGNSDLSWLGDAFVVAPSGTVTFRDNPIMCTSRIDGFAAALPGWRGILVNENNGGC